MRLSARSRRAMLAAVAGTTLVLSGCGKDTGSGSGSVSLGFVNGADTEFHTCLQKALEQTAKSEGAKVYTANSHQNSGTELSNIEDMISRNVSALVVQTVNVDALKGDIAKAKASNIPIYLTSVATSDVNDILGAAVVDLGKVGALDAGWVAKDAGGKDVQVGVIAGAPGAASDLLVGGFTKALPGNVKVVANQPGMFNAAKAQDVAENMIQAHPDLDYAFVANEEMGLAARKAFDAAGAKDVKIVTVNGTDDGLAAVEDGRFSATVSNSAMTIGQTAVKDAIGLLDKKKVDKIANIPLLLVTKDNLSKAPQYCPK
ncbi:MULTISPECIES: sugar ABC transporter substrate-binding protein [unclassified Streptomyces]|uniref:sugar ABC transporter substrate-binding protein n=1 Tax=unclassified Streptomyces TaxID=2593676 RepID=UPI002255B2C2|nr:MULTISPECIES: sugar ABC transporter substrate-binding protein [unclassified Streptomyces]MCX4405131.1 sugar ABC transporter substrate-binding protein [Streptomyces sp. NBC_01764]MCX5190320.1 sugar ABC transporter substrate-binding protein [Streptomyces sp. NBC_00268]